MHDPLTQAFDIKNPFVKKRNDYRPSLITIWHKDPEKDGTDDSCGWFKRSRHGDKEVLEKIQKEFAFNFKHNYWFNEAGYPQLSTIAITLNMYHTAAWIVFNRNRKKVNGFMKKHLYDFMRFAENPTDSLGDSINMRFGVEKVEYRIESFASIIYGDILRKQQKWYQHPRWHIHHWRIQFHPFQQLKRRYWDKCCICGKRGFKGSAMGDWDGTKIWHQECERQQPQTNPTT